MTVQSNSTDSYGNSLNREFYTFYFDLDGRRVNTFGTNDDLSWKNASFSDNLTSVDLIIVELDIGEQTAPLAGYGCYADELICVKDGKLVLIAFERDNWIS